MQPERETYNNVLDRLFGEVERISSGTDWKKIQIASKILNAMSPRNSVLVAMQARDRNLEVTKLAGYRNWQKLRRQVRKGEQGFSILAPVHGRVSPKLQPKDNIPASFSDSNDQSLDRPIVGFRWVSVFDISQTDGDCIEAPVPQQLTGESVELDRAFHSMSQIVSELGFKLKLAQLEGANGLTDFSTKEVILNDNLSSAQRVKTLAHELSHIELHSNGVISRQIAEIEAETSAFLIMSQLNIDTDSYSFPYIASWSGGNLALVVSVGERAQIASRAIHSRLHLEDD